eukprot:720496-Pelagomonas_calceolata.AAC.1
MVGETARLIEKTEGEPSSTTTGLRQVQNHTHFAPMIIEKWGLPFFKKAGFQPATTSTTARTDIECACQICNYHGSYEPINSEPPYLDMYICDVYQRTYY